MIPLTRGTFAMVSRRDYARINAHNWYCSAFGYAVRFIRDGNGKKICLYMHKEILRPSVGFETDHVSMNRLDNRRRNLRPCTKVQNQGNRNGSRGYPNKLSPFKGVHWVKKDARFAAHITIGGRCRRLGGFSSDVDAAKAYNAAAVLHFGQFARLNPV